MAQKSLTRLNLKSLLIILVCTFIAGLAVYLLILENRNIHYRQMFQQHADRIAIVIQMKTSELRLRLEKTSHEKRVIEAFTVKKQGAFTALRKEIQSHYPDTVAVNFIVENLTDGRIAWGPLKNQAMRISLDVNNSARINLYQKVYAQDKLLGIVVLSYPTKYFSDFIKNKLPKVALIAIRQHQANSVLHMVLSKAEGKDDKYRENIIKPINGTYWDLLVNIPAQTNSLSFLSWVYIGLLILMAMLVATNSIVLYLKTSHFIENDIRSMARMFRDISKGSVREKYSLELIEFSAIFQYLRDSSQKIMEQKQAFKDMGLIDHLSQLSNRRHFEARLRRLFSKIETTGPSAVLIIDLDHFKAVNDQYGHDAGDTLITEFANILKKNIRGTDFVARLGGDEFCVVYTYASLHQAEEMAYFLRERLPDKIDLPRGEHYKLRWTGGISLMNPKDKVYNDVLLRADQALIRAKEAGRNMTLVIGPNEKIDKPKK